LQAPVPPDFEQLLGALREDAREAAAEETGARKPVRTR